MRRPAALTPLGALLFALLCAAGVIAAAGGDPAAAFRALALGAVGSANGVLRTLAKATPLLFTGLAVALALRAGLFNIGAEGQLVAGGLAAAWAGFAVPGLSMAVHLPLALGAGVLAGAVWGFVPGLLRALRGTHEVIVTIMMNHLAFELTRWLVNGPLKDPGTLATATPHVLPTARLWSLPGGTHFSAGFGLALASAAAVAFLFRRTALGFEIRATGLGPEAARAGGVDVRRTLALTMALSGGLAGLAGAVEVLAVHKRFYDAFSPGYGFDSIAVALLGGLSASGVAASALLFGALNAGAPTMEALTGTPRQISGIVQALVILAMGARLFRRRP